MESHRTNDSAELKELIITECDLDISVDGIGDDDALFGSDSPIRLDSVDALQVSIAVGEQWRGHHRQQGPEAGNEDDQYLRGLHTAGVTPMNKVLHPGELVACSLGREIDGIITARSLSRRPRTCPSRIASLDYTRPYRLPWGDEERAADLEGFYNVFPETTGRASRTRASPPTRPGRAPSSSTTSIDIPVFEETCRKSSQDGPKTLSNESPGYGKILIDTPWRSGSASGPRYTFTTACTSSANCLLYAASMIMTGRASGRPLSSATTSSTRSASPSANR